MAIPYYPLLSPCIAGKRELVCFDVYSASQRVACAFRKIGKVAQSFDIQSDKRHDVTTRMCFLLMLAWGMMSLGEQEDVVAICCNLQTLLRVLLDGCAGGTVPYCAMVIHGMPKHAESLQITF